MLSYAGYQVINLRGQTGFPLLEKLSLRFNPVKSSEIILFYRQMALLVESGINLVNAIELLKLKLSTIFSRKP